MIRYIPVTSEDEWEIGKDTHIFIEDKEPDIPYIKIKIKILEKCKLYDTERDEPIKNIFRRFIHFIISKLEKYS